VIIEKPKLIGYKGPIIQLEQEISDQREQENICFSYLTGTIVTNKEQKSDTSESIVKTESQTIGDYILKKMEEIHEKVSELRGLDNKVVYMRDFQGKK
jgi:hypothetical protein